MNSVQNCNFHKLITRKKDHLNPKIHFNLIVHVGMEQKSANHFNRLHLQHYPAMAQKPDFEGRLVSLFYFGF